MKQRIISLLLILCALLYCFPGSAFAAGESDVPAIQVGSASAKTGSLVQLSVDLSGNPGINTFTLGIDYDTTRLKLTKVSVNSELGGRSVYHKKLVWFRSSNTNYTGNILTLSFEVLVKAAAGDAEVTLTYRPGDISNYSEKNVDFTILPGKVAVTEAHPNCPSKDFTDVPDYTNWAHEGIDYAVSNGLFNGTSYTTFSPNNAMTRAMLVTVLWRYQGSPEVGENVFADVKPNEWYTKAVAWAAHEGIVNGVTADRFAPDQPIAREQMTTILFRFANRLGLDTSARGSFAPFKDGNAVSSYAVEGLQWAVAEGIINGSDGKLLPQGNATRAQVAAILMRFIENVVKK